MSQQNVSVAPHGGGPVKRRLPALTSLRFFAAALVVYYHTSSYLWLPSSAWLPVIQQGVSIFFVLSGFVLTYVYPEIADWRAAVKFFRARIARIWPAYIFSIVFAVLIYPRSVTALDADILVGRLITNLLAIQSWAPAGEIFYSLNGPSWSVSAEVLFYALFPLLILNFGRTWWLKLLGSFSLVVLIISLVLLFDIPSYRPGLDFSLHVDALIYISPYARIFEFVCGMCAARLWQRYNLLSGAGRLYATALELLSLAFLIFNDIIGNFVFRLAPALNNPVSAQWLGQAGGSAVPTAILLIVLASNRGLIASAMSASWLVMLGELSFSIYLLHYPLLQLFNNALPRVADGLHWPTVSLYLAMLFLLTHMTWILIERPCREMIVGTRGYHVRRTGSGILDPSWKSAAVDGALLLALIVLFLMKAAVPASWGPNAERAIAATPADIRDAKFGSLAELKGYEFVPRQDGATLYLNWESLEAIDRRTSFAVHLLQEPDGEIVAQGDYPGKLFPTKQGQRFEDAVTLSSSQLANACYVAIGVYPTATGNLVVVDRGPTDWGGHRLLIPVPPSLNGNCSSSSGI